VDNPELQLKPGMTATVMILIEEARDRLTVPNAALRFIPHGLLRPQLEELRRRIKTGQGVVWRAGAGGNPEPVIVTLGPSDDSVTAVEGDLAVGDKVWLSEAVSKRSAPKRRLHF
jgi:HlyD family secretion protein